MLKVALGRVEWPGGSAGGAYHNSVVIFSRKKRPFFYFWSAQILGASLVGPPTLYVLYQVADGQDPF